MIKFTLDDKFTIKCDSLPTVKRNDKYSKRTLVFITADNHAIFADAHKKKFWIINFGNSFPEINCTTLLHGYIVLIWCCEDESVFLTTKEDDIFFAPKMGYAISFHTHWILWNEIEIATWTAKFIWKVWFLLVHGRCIVTFCQSWTWKENCT